MDCEPILQPLLNYAEDFTVMEIEDLTSLLNYCVSQADGSNHVSMDTIEGEKILQPLVQVFTHSVNACINGKNVG